MSIAKAASTKLDWAKVISSLKLTGKTATQLSAFKKRNDEARRTVYELNNQPKEVDFAHYRAVLKNQEIVDKIEKFVTSYKPTTYDVSKQLATIAAFEASALENAKETEAVVAKELTELAATLKNIESARPFDELTIEDVVAARPDIDAKVEEMVQKGRWEVPGYKEKFGDLTVM